MLKLTVVQSIKLVKISRIPISFSRLLLFCFYSQRQIRHHPPKLVRNSKSLNRCFLTLVFSTDDIPIQVTKDEQNPDGKVNLVSISEEHESMDLTRSSMRQSKDGRKLPSFPSLGKKPKDKEGKSKNGYVTATEKERKLSTQSMAKDVKFNDQGEIDGGVIRKKNTIVESNVITGDSVTSLLDSGETLENVNLDALNLKDSETLPSSMQVSSV